MRKIFILIFISFFCTAAELKHTLIKKGIENNNTMLVIGGIQGDEPGGFLAASLLSTDYEITKGSIWIVPNLNFPSIIKRSRGLHGDMNRKFSQIKDSDPDFVAVTHIKKIIIDKKVALVVNLHDGSGFYRKTYIDKNFNPNRWGNSCIIDQKQLNGVKYGNLKDIAKQVTDSINQNLIDEKHRYYIRNTKTREGDQEMLKSLTFFAIDNNKAAFANEASKSLNASERTYYHLLALEAYMKLMKIEFKRNFELTPQGVFDAINRGVEINLYDNKIFLKLDKSRSIIRYVPISNKEPIKYTASNPLTAVVKDKDGYVVHYGNRKLTKLVPQYFDYTDSLQNIEVLIDGFKQSVPIGSLVSVEKDFLIPKQNNQRVNIIGYSHPQHKNEAGLKIDKKSLQKSYSIDKNGKIYRVEIYDTSKSQKGTFLGMFLVELK